MTKINLSDIDNLISEYKELQENSSINNFFPYYKICSYLKKYIEDNISLEELEMESLTNVELALNKLKRCFKLYKSNFQAHGAFSILWRHLALISNFLILNWFGKLKLVLTCAFHTNLTLWLHQAQSIPAG